MSIGHDGWSTIPPCNNCKKFQDENVRLRNILRLYQDRVRIIGEKVWDTKTSISIFELLEQMDIDIAKTLKDRNEKIK